MVSLRPKLAYGWSNPDDEIKADVLREVLYTASNLLAVGTKLLPTINYKVLDVQFEYPGAITGEYPVAIGGITRVEKVTWSSFNMTLKQAQVRWAITDDAIIRELEDQQEAVSTKRAAEALAELKDKNIIDAIEAGDYVTDKITVAAGAEWNVNSGTTDIEQDFLAAKANILNDSNVTLADLDNMSLLVPTKAYPSLEKLCLIGNVNRSMEDYLETAFGTLAYPSRHSSLTDDAYLVVYGEDTGRHGVLLQHPKVPLVEPERARAVGWDYLIRQFFETKITPFSSSDSTSHRIIDIYNVVG